MKLIHRLIRIIPTGLDINCLPDALHSQYYIMSYYVTIPDIMKFHYHNRPNLSNHPPV